MSDAEGADIRALIDAMKGEQVARVNEEALETAQLLERDPVERLDVPEPVERMHAELVHIKQQRAALEAMEKRISEAIKMVTGSHQGLAMGGKALSKVNVTTTFRVNSKLIAELFPRESHPNLYIESTTATLLIDNDFKKEVISNGEITS